VKRLTCIFLLSLFAACSNRTDIPKEIIPPDSMQRILKDVIMAGEYGNQYISNDSLIKDKIKANQELMDGIFKIHRITREEFTNSLKFYESRPDLNKRIFDSLTADANRRKTELYLPKPLSPTHPVPVK
jgi:Domain of unknown function (DUF4296)